MIQKNNVKIGIIGGAGPMASCQLYKEIINECQQRYGCKNDSDFPEITVLNYPFSNMLTKTDAANNKHLTSELQLCFDRLAAQNIDIVAIGCNTLHTFLDNVMIRVPEFVNIAQATMNYARALGLNRLFILGTQTTMQTGLYAQNNVDSIVPSIKDSTIIDKIIQNILDGTITQTDALKLQTLVQKYFDKTPFDAIILGCTELPLLNAEFPLKIIDEKQRALPVLDTVKILAQTIMRHAFESR